MINEITQFIEENDVKFVRLAFCDLYGNMKNISIMASEIERALQDGIGFDASSVKGYCDVSKSDLFLCPDVSTLGLLPWRPSQGSVVRFYCALKDSERKIYELDTREKLKAVIKKFDNLGLSVKIGTECEFYLFKLDSDGKPTYEPLDEGECFDVAPLDKGENVRRDICLTLEEMGMHPENSHHENGWGQNEIDFKYDDALQSADNFMTLKSTVKAIANQNGLFASFMPKPLKDMSGNGLHINLSLFKDDKNQFTNGIENSELASSFIAGVMNRIKDMSLFLNSTNNSYDRLGKCEAPKYISWSRQNRSSLIRIPAAHGENVRMELRSADSCINPYIAFTLIMSAGLEGIENKMTLPKEAIGNLYNVGGDELELLPTSLKEAIEIAKNSDFLKNTLGELCVSKFVEDKQNEIKAFERVVDKEVYIYKNYFKKY